MPRDVAHAPAGWALLVAGVAGWCGAFGVWVDAGAAVTYGGALTGPLAAAAAVGAAAVGLLVVAGLGRRWLAGLGVGCAAVMGGAAVRGYAEVHDYYDSGAARAGWGLHVTLAAAVLALGAGVVGMLVRRPRAAGWPLTVRPRGPVSEPMPEPVPEPMPEPAPEPTPEPAASPLETGTPTFSRAAVRSGASTSSARPGSATVRPARAAPMAGGLMIVAGVVGLVAAFGTWRDSLLLPDGGPSGAGADEPFVIAAAIAVLVCGACIVNGTGGIAPPIVALCVAPAALLVTFVEFGSIKRLFIEVTVPDGLLEDVGWGLYGYAAAMLVVLGCAVRTVGYRVAAGVSG